jgi:UDP-galactose transporter
MRYCRSIPGESLFLTQTAVIMGEVLKGTLSAILVLRDHGTLAGVWVNTWEAVKSGVPAMLYLVQNNLQYVAVSNLEANTYQVTYQLKILSTGLLSVMFLGKSLSGTKWLALVILTAGVAVVQVSQTQSSAKSNVNLPVGLACTLMATVSSGMASVYFEKMLKDGSPMDVWQRNFQLAVYSVVIGCFAMLGTDQGARVLEDGFFQGYTITTWVNISIQGGGGLLIAMVIKYADSIMKNIATSMSTVVCAVMSLAIFNTPLNAYFILGAVMVNYATYLYSK